MLFHVSVFDSGNHYTIKIMLEEIHIEMKIIIRKYNA